MGRRDGNAFGGGMRRIPQAAAGVVLFRVEGGTRRYLLVRSALTRRPIWEFPKGGVERGETEAQAALRELREESGITAHEHTVVDGWRQEERYVFTQGEAGERSLIVKRVVYFLAESRTAQVVLSREALEYRWAPYEEAHRLLRFPGKRTVLERAEAFLRAAEAPLVPAAGDGMDLDTLRAAVVAADPSLAASRFARLPDGWHSVAVDVDDRWVFRFARHAEAARALEAEARLLAVVHPAVTVRVPRPVFHPGPPAFSRHEKIPGEHLTPARYERLPGDARARLAADLARLYAELHALDGRTMAAAGASPVRPWLPPAEIRRLAGSALAPGLRAWAEETLAAWEALPADPHGTVYGYFDGHGWNLAFDHAQGRLNGVYDFGDSGFGPLHQEFVYANLVSPDLAARVIDAYEARTGRALDRRRIEVLTGVLRLSELAESAHDAALAPEMLRSVAAWAARG